MHFFCVYNKGLSPYLLKFYYKRNKTILQKMKILSKSFRDCTRICQNKSKKKTKLKLKFSILIFQTLDLMLKIDCFYILIILMQKLMSFYFFAVAFLLVTYSKVEQYMSCNCLRRWCNCIKVLLELIVISWIGIYFVY
jgi:uncharacterized membrane protein